MLKWLVPFLLCVYWLVSTPMPFFSKCQRFQTAVEGFLATDSADECVIRTQRRVRESLEVFERVVDEYRFDEIAISYNGGKDCLVMLMLYMATLARRYSSEELDGKSLSAVLVNYEPQFPELLSFIQETAKEYELNLMEYNAEMKDGFRLYLDTHPQIKTIIVGTRRTDPYASVLKPIQRTDHGWPDFIRVHPVLDWKYDEIWCFLRTTKTKYCVLYDMGYTSLGGTGTTARNPALLTGEGYRPAHELEEGDERERHGRTR